MSSDMKSRFSSFNNVVMNYDKEIDIRTVQVEMIFYLSELHYYCQTIINKIPNMDKYYADLKRSFELFKNDLYIVFRDFSLKYNKIDGVIDESFKNEMSKFNERKKEVEFNFTESREYLFFFGDCLIYYYNMNLVIHEIDNTFELVKLCDMFDKYIRGE